MTLYLDIDGTIADVKARYKKAGKEPRSRGRRWSYWLRRVQNHKTLAEDVPIKGMVDFAHSLSCNLIYLTGRSEVYRKVTQEWLKRNGFPLCALIMRPKGNKQKNGVLKEALIKDNLLFWDGSEDVIVVDDDFNGDIEEACHRNGWTFLKAKSGSYW